MRWAWWVLGVLVGCDGGGGGAPHCLDGATPDGRPASAGGGSRRAGGRRGRRRGGRRGAARRRANGGRGRAWRRRLWPPTVPRPSARPVEEVAPGVFVAIGYDLASTILIRTAAGNVIVDAGMSPARARETRAALDAVAPGPVVALIYTHSHIDHVGGASVFVEAGTEIWATEAFLPHLLKQYGAFREGGVSGAERQFGQDLPDAELAVLGPRAPSRCGGGPADRRPATHPHVLGVVHPRHRRHDPRAGGGPRRDPRRALRVAAGRARAAGGRRNLYAAFPNLYTIAAPRRGR
ncbi:MAG: MBL fold metallo-hydrolase [bacterium]